MSIEAMRQALEALEKHEPLYLDRGYAFISFPVEHEKQPKKREWISLTDQERLQIALTVKQYKLSQVDYSKAVYMAWEAKLKEKNYD